MLVCCCWLACRVLPRLRQRSHRSLSLLRCLHRSPHSLSSCEHQSGSETRREQFTRPARLEAAAEERQRQRQRQKQRQQRRQRRQRWQRSSGSSSSRGRGRSSSSSSGGGSQRPEGQTLEGCLARLAGRNRALSTPGGDAESQTCLEKNRGSRCTAAILHAITAAQRSACTATVLCANPSSGRYHLDHHMDALPPAAPIAHGPRAPRRNAATPHMDLTRRAANTCHTVCNTCPHCIARRLATHDPGRRQPGLRGRALRLDQGDSVGVGLACLFGVG